MSKEWSIGEKVKLFKSRFVGREDVFNIDKTKYDQVTIDPNVKVKKKEWVNQDNVTGERFPLSDVDIIKHIRGEAPIALFQRLVDDNVRFVVVDFDHPWDYEHVVEVQKAVWRDYNVPCYMAKSSRKGWHLIFFFEDWIDFKYFTSFWSFVIQETIIESYVKSEEVSPDGKFFSFPEVFPRPSSYGDADPDSLTCGAIKPPMVEPRMANKFNAFHAEFESQPYCVEDQWAYLESTQFIKTSEFKEILQKLEIDIYEPNVKRVITTVKDDGSTEDELVEFSKTEVKKSGHFAKVIEGCPALKAAWEQKHPQDHKQRVALGCIANATLDGHEKLLEFAKQNPHWQHDTTKKHLDGIAKNNCKPITCHKMQMHGICIAGIHPKLSRGDRDKVYCLEPNKQKLPDGRFYIPQPSPVRFGRDKKGTQDISLAKLQTRIDSAVEELNGCAKKKKKPGQKDYDTAMSNFREACIYTLLHLTDLRNESERESIKSYIENQEFVTKTMLKDLFREAKKRRRILIEERWQNDNSTIEIHKKRFAIKNNSYVQLKFNEKEGVEQEIQLTNFVIIFENEKQRVQNLGNRRGDGNANRYVSGYVLLESGKRCPFEDIPTIDFESGSMNKIYEKLANIMGAGSFTYEKRPDDIRNCIKQFNQGSFKNYKEVLMVDDCGWNKGVYLASNCYINKDGIHSLEHSPPVKEAGGVSIQLNTESWKSLPISVKNNFEKAPTMMLLNENSKVMTPRQLLQHFFRDFLKWHEPEITYLGAGFALSAALQRFFPDQINKISPSLFFVGLYGRGKSQVLKALQNFYGPYEQILNWNNSGKNLIDNAHYFKDMVIGVDDYKKTLVPEYKVIQFIQIVYDRYIRGVQTITGESRAKKPPKGLFVLGGEDIFEADPSAASRCLIIDFNKYCKTKDNYDQYQRCAENWHMYSSITSHLIKYAVSRLSENVWREWYDQAHKMFGGISHGSGEGSERLLGNIIIPYMGFRALLQMAYDEFQILETNQFNNHLMILQKACISIMEDTSSKLREDKSGLVYLRELSDLISSNPNQYYIEGMGYRPNNNLATRLGWIDEKDKDIVYLFKDVALREIARKSNVGKHGKVRQTINTIAQTLYEDGFLAKTTASIKPYFAARFEDPDTKQKTQPRVLAIKRSAVFNGELEPPAPPHEDSGEVVTKPLTTRRPDHDPVSGAVKNYAPGSKGRRVGDEAPPM